MNTSPALVALAAELVLHVQDVMVVEMTSDMEVGTFGRWVVVDVKEAWIQVQVSPRVDSLADAPAVLLAQRFAAQLGSRRDVDDVMSQRTVDVLLHRLTVPLAQQEST